MGSPNQLMREAESISYGFLAAKTSSVLREVLEGKPIGADDQHVLEDASQFLQDISDGARFTANGNFREGANPSRSIAALDVAFGAIDLLKQLVKQEKEVATLFERLAQAVRAARVGQVTAEIADSVRTADRFFEALGAWLSNELHSQKPLIGSRRSY
jgi:hypothetical protein